jgi:hypothetical protein
MAEVHAQASDTGGVILRDRGMPFPNGLEWQMHATDEARTTVFKLRFSAKEPRPGMPRGGVLGLAPFDLGATSAPSF